MPDFHLHHQFPLRHFVLVCAIVLMQASCAVGPDFAKPESEAPANWTDWRSADNELHTPFGSTAELSAEWWRMFGDPVLDRLEQRAFEASPDVHTAALHFAQARVQHSMVAAQRGPEISVGGDVSRQSQSENNAGMRIIDAIGADRDALAKILSEPFNLYQAGFDASWEPDLWGRIGRSVEAADADIANQAALLDMARLSLASDVARTYFEFRTTQRLIRLVRDDIEALKDRVAILEARVQGGTIDHLDLERQRAELSGIKAQLPGLLAQEGASANQIALLLGERPGALRSELAAPAEATTAVLPALGLGVPSEVALRRPDIRAAEARLHRATARIGIARADLYPSIRLGANFGYESYLSGEFSDWGSQTWSVGASLDLPLFDNGRRKSVVTLRELEQQEAAVNYQQTVLKAWQEIDDAISGYTAEQQQALELEARLRSASLAYELTQARYKGGTVDFIAVLDSQRGYLQARLDLTSSQGRVNTRYVMVNKSIGNVLTDVGMAKVTAK
jgi:NodT family efflux transporter outer membrane factor (OMF) lipoprotein